MNSFTDDDLEQLKESLFCGHTNEAGCYHEIFGPSHFKALLSRLEAAEKAHLDGTIESHMAWRKSAGK